MQCLLHEPSWSCVRSTFCDPKKGSNFRGDTKRRAEASLSSCSFSCQSNLRPCQLSRRRRYQGDAPFHSNQFPIISIALENSDQRLKLVATNRKEESSAKATIVIAGWSPLMSLIQIIGWQLNIGMYHWHFMDLLYWTGHDNRPPCQSGNPMHMS